METKASLQNVLDFLGSGEPVIALVAPKARALHYVVLNGFDQNSETIRYVNTNGVEGSWTFEEFARRWQWTNYFKGFRGRIMQFFSKAAGVRPRTFLACPRDPAPAARAGEPRVPCSRGRLCPSPSPGWG